MPRVRNIIPPLKDVSDEIWVYSDDSDSGTTSFAKTLKKVIKELTKKTFHHFET